MIARIRGSGMAASCCAHLLGQAGIDTVFEAVVRPPVPAIMLSDQALGLMRDVFARPALFADKPRIEHRIVAWGQAEPVALPHEAVVVSEEDLAVVAPEMLIGEPVSDADFTIHTTPPMPAATFNRFGDRQAVAALVQLKNDADASACWIESVEHGWLFLIPGGTDGAWLLAVGAPLAQILGESHNVAPRVELLGPMSSAFETCPRMLSPLCGPDWLACGTAAIAFDPICGDGTAQAVREAILAAAVVGAIGEGGASEALRMHYDSMLTAAMRRHLQLSAQFYRTGGQSEWWREQFDALMEGYAWCTARLATMPEPRYNLRGFRLAEREKVG